MPDDLTPTEREAIANADAHLTNAGLPGYSDLVALLGSIRAPRWRHVRRGSEYAEIGRFEVQCASPIAEGDTVVAYRGVDGKGWARPEIEFLDGRFSPLRGAPGGADAQG
ncbi:hypothetical protein [Methylibium petroleiphilum]|uniref:DUF1653 domain-containing protein n=1 Tax=Methylibium petroleiphilum (strain ATCC BAA-1232 / LMG 22953 / PM1) TaxID=420662 RepID=A2SN43_METPP|nr:hypothetical protein [Methylibium petroleiphilum]ABM96982.1 hypothetical protein Mpe_B0207 [Methylibium petroleiphilum PM1]